jgi:hypothetical protein
MNQIPAPSTIIAAAVVMQFFLVAIAAVGAYLIDKAVRSTSRFYENPTSVGKQAWVIVGFAILTLGPLVLSDGFAGSWLALSYPASISVIKWHHALIFVFLVDIVFTLILVRQTAGSDRSAFTALYFILPSLAFFLREPPKLIVGYVVLVALCFSFGLIGEERLMRDPPKTKLPFWLVSMLCLALSLMIGLLTRPH